MFKFLFYALWYEQFFFALFFFLRYMQFISCRIVAHIWNVFSSTLEESCEPFLALGLIL